MTRDEICSQRAKENVIHHLTVHRVGWYRRQLWRVSCDCVACVIVTSLVRRWMIGWCSGSLRQQPCCTRHTSHVTHHTSHVTHHTSHITRHTSHITHHTSHITHHTSHVTRHTSHITRHTSHVTRHSTKPHLGIVGMPITSHLDCFASAE